jgi:hypothetical protein
MQVPYGFYEQVLWQSRRVPLVSRTKIQTLHCPRRACFLPLPLPLSLGSGVSNHKLRLFAARFVSFPGRAFVSSVPRSLLMLAGKKIVGSWFYEEVCRWLQRRRRVVYERSYVFSPPFLVSLHLHNLFCLSVSPHLRNNTATTSLTKAMRIFLLAP